MPTHTCTRCQKEFIDKSTYNRHLKRKTPCALILDKEDLPLSQKDNPNRCKFCGRVFSTRAHMLAHMKKACKIAPREGNEDGMEKLYEHTLRKQEERHKTELAALEARMKSEMKAEISAALTGGALVPIAPAVPAVQTAAQAAAQTAVTGTNQGVVAQTAHVAIDNSVNKTTNNTIKVTINIFGRENLDRITKPQIFQILRSLGEVGPTGENLKTICEKAILHAAMIIFSDPHHPENLTCFVPSKKGDDALVHGADGWEVQPIGLVMSPMASQAVEALFKHQPYPEIDMSKKDVDWVMGECGRIMRYMADHEGNLTNEPARGELRGILIRNKDLLNQVLAKLPMAGDA